MIHVVVTGSLLWSRDWSGRKDFVLQHYEVFRSVCCSRVRRSHVVFRHAPTLDVQGLQCPRHTSGHLRVQGTLHKDDEQR
jgi:hypothetical protein